jgi:hypothetical protein
MKKTSFTATSADGTKERWTFYRQKYSSTEFKGQRTYWVLRDPAGYERIIEQTWIDTVPHIHSILKNHGLTANIS